MFTVVRAGFAAFAALTLSACVTTSMQGHADLEIPAQPLQRIAVYVAAQGPLAATLQASVREEARLDRDWSRRATAAYHRSPVPWRMWQCRNPRSSSFS